MLENESPVVPPGLKALSASVEDFSRDLRANVWVFSSLEDDGRGEVLKLSVLTEKSYVYFMSYEESRIY